jgi:hypothetical protein
MGAKQTKTNVKNEDVDSLAEAEASKAADALDAFMLSWSCCKHCGVGPGGFSIRFDQKQGTYKSVWDKYCSMGCSVAGDGSPVYVCL